MLARWPITTTIVGLVLGERSFTRVREVTRGWLGPVTFYGLVDDRIAEVIEFFAHRADAEEMLAECLADGQRVPLSYISSGGTPDTDSQRKTVGSRA
jgi:hypothetical protein